jgi:predicted nuclease with TOPRIM domain
MVSSPGWNASATGYTSRLAEYKETVSRLFPILPKDCVDAWSISEADVLALGLLLECYPRDLVVLDIGTLVGASSFFFASHPKVTRVVSIDSNPTLADEINDKSEMIGGQIDSQALRDLKVLDVARAALATFPCENRKVQLQVSTIGTDRIGLKVDSSPGPEMLDGQMSELSAEESLVAFVGGLHTRRGVQADLQAIFELNPRAVAILDNCRHSCGPFVQAEVVRFMEGAQDEYGFRLLGDLSPGTATSNLGILYPKVDDAGVHRALTEFAELFSERLDPLRLLRREEELITTVNRYKDAANYATTLQERNARLEENNSRLEERNTLLQEHNTQLKEHSTELGERNTELREHITHLKEHSTRLGEQISQLKERNTQLKERLSQVRERSTQLGARNSELEERLSELEVRSSGLEDQNSQLKQENLQLDVYRSSRRYKIADAVAQKLRWMHIRG